MPVYSHSRLSTFEQCKLKFKYSYLDKFKPDFPTSVEAFIGSRVHDTLEKLYKDLKYNKQNSIQELIEYYNSEWKDKWTEDIKIVKTEFSQENYRDTGERFIRAYYEKHKPFDQHTTIATEMYVTVDLEDGKKLQGYVDRLSSDDNGVYYIHDYKTGNSLPTQQSVDEDRQLALYSIAVKEKYRDCKDVRLIWHYLAFSKELESSRRDEELERLKAQTMQLIDEIESETNFTPTKSALCSWCGFRSRCPEWKHLHELEESPQLRLNSEDGAALVDEYEKLKDEQDKLDKRMEAIKEKLFEFAKDNELKTVFGRNMKANVSEYTKLSFPKRGDPEQDLFYDAIKKIGLWDELAVPDVYKLTKMINNDEIHKELVVLLERYINRNQNKTIRLSKR